VARKKNLEGKERYVAELKSALVQPLPLSRALSLSLPLSLPLSLFVCVLSYVVSML
jgi:hypothetical protein